MWFKRRRSDRPDPSRRRLGSSLETLESRTVLSQTAHPFAVYLPTDLPVANPLNHAPISLSALHLLIDNNPQSPLLSNQGKVVSGRDLAGNQWTITVHGPGSVIVTDASPNDGSLENNIDTITLVGTSPTSTYVTGQTQSSAETQTDGEVLFNKLSASSGVKSIILNGFTLAQTVTPAGGAPNNLNTGVFLTGGVGFLSFDNIDAPINTATDDLPIDIVIGSASTPLKQQPTIQLGSIFNTVFDSESSTIPTAPPTSPTVNIIVNGTLNGLHIDSSTQVAEPAGRQFLFPIVGSTGRTAIQAQAIGSLSVRGSAINLTASQGTGAFTSGFSGLNHLGHAAFYGNADGVGLDVSQGKIGKVAFFRGLGNPTGTSTAASSFGTPAAITGYPAAGLVGGQVTAKKIGSVTAGPANHVLLHAQNPNFVQLGPPGSPTYFAQPGNALTSASISASGSIKKVRVRGDLVNSEIKSGFNFPSAAAGLEGTRARSSVSKVRVNGNLVNGVLSATYRPGTTGEYGSPTDVAGPGKITGQVAAKNAVYNTGASTALGNTGSGVFARTKSDSNLPPPSLPTRGKDSVQVR
jgi:hypothetical protein